MSPLRPDRNFAALLFDMDGTILTSIAAAERVWAAWALQRGLDPAKLVPTIHGVRAIETIRRQQLPDVDPVAEAEAVTQAEIADVEGIEPIAGAVRFLASIPRDRWAVVTSCPLPLALARLEAAGLPRPPLLITAYDIKNGKPAPDGFLLAAEKLGVDINDCAVFEDAVAGIQAGEAAGATVIVVTATHQHPHGGPQFSIVDYEGLDVRRSGDGGLSLRGRET